MNDLILPPGIKFPTQIQPAEKPKEDATDEEKATQLPDPSGYKLLCIVPEVSKKIDGTELDLEKPTDFMRREEQTTSVLFVAKVGPDAYKDAAKFPSGPWCKAGDFVMVRTYTGTRFKMYGKEMRLINDDQIEGVVQDPRGISHV
jgi:co-chaperonin GroES (HSP10)